MQNQLNMATGTCFVKSAPNSTEKILFKVILKVFLKGPI